MTRCERRLAERSTFYDPKMRVEMASLRTEMGTRLDRIEADLRQFYHDLGRHEGEIDALRRRS
ncbi:MAG: hypothetical protein ACRD3D_04425 [Terriglobia bacterium]